MDTEHYRDPHRAVRMRRVLDGAGVWEKDLTMAVERKVSASTQNQALSALLFLYAIVVGRFASGS